MKTADEMFEELGYKIHIGEFHGIINCINEEEGKYINFYLDSKTFECYEIANNMLYPLEIDSKLLKAICKKFEELGWV